MNASLEQLGKVVMITGLVIAAIGFLLVVSGKLSWTGRLPGDILIRKKNFVLYVPLATSILLSIVISLILYLSGKK